MKAANALLGLANKGVKNSEMGTSGAEGKEGGKVLLR